MADLDGNGRMEVLTTVQGIDDLGARLWAYRAGQAEGRRLKASQTPTFSLSRTRLNAARANSRSSWVWAAEGMVRMRALPLATVG